LAPRSRASASDIVGAAWIGGTGQ
jgi:hypothetical protein